MNFFIMNEKGNLGLAMAIVVIALLSNITMTGIAFKDVVSTRMQQDGLQETHRDTRSRVSTINSFFF